MNQCPHCGYCPHCGRRGYVNGLSNFSYGNVMGQMSMQNPQAYYNSVYGNPNCQHSQNLSEYYSQAQGTSQ